MRQILLLLMAITTTLCLNSCRRTFQYSILEVNPTAENLNKINIDKINKLVPKDTFSFLLIADTQVAYDQLEDFVEHANNTYSESEIAFVLNAGDFTDYGANFEYNMYYQDIKKLNFPSIGTIGNHDMLANGRKIYRKMFGIEDFSFSYGNTRFIIFNSNSREVKFNGLVPNISWLQNEINNTEEDNIIYLSHISPTNTDFDPALVDGMTKLIANSTKSRLSMNGHTHSFEYHEPFADGMKYLVGPTIHKREYVKVNVINQNIEVEKIAF